MKSSERRCRALTIFENVHGAKMEKGMYTNLYTEIWDSMIFRDMVNKCTMNTKPAKMAVCGFVILREILGLSSSLSATESCKSKDLQGLFFFVLLSSLPFVYHHIKW